MYKLYISVHNPFLICFVGFPQSFLEREGLRRQSTVSNDLLHFDSNYSDTTIFMVTSCINDIKHFYCPTNAHNLKKT